MRGLPQKQNARRADKIRLCGHLRRYKKIVKKTYIICNKYRTSPYVGFDVWSDEKDVDLFYQIEQSYKDNEYYKKFTK